MVWYDSTPGERLKSEQAIGQDSGYFEPAGAAAAAQAAAQAYTDSQLSASQNLLAYAEEFSGAATAFTTAAVQINGMVITVPPTSRPVRITYQAALTITTAGAGAVLVGLYETTSGSPVALDAVGVGGSLLAGTGSQSVNAGPHEYWLQTGVTTPRNFSLYAVAIRDAASTLAASVRSSASANPKTILTAVAM